jgi:hypothetical protein
VSWATTSCSKEIVSPVSPRQTGSLIIKRSTNVQRTLTFGRSGPILTSSVRGTSFSFRIGWIRQVLKPEFVAPDLRERLRAARAIISGQDAFLARYKMDQYNIQIIVTQFHLHLVIAPVSVSPMPITHYSSALPVF